MEGVDGSAGVLPHLQALRAGLEFAGAHPAPPVGGAQPGGPARKSWTASCHFKVLSVVPSHEKTFLLFVESQWMNQACPASLSVVCAAASSKLSPRPAAVSIELRVCPRAYR